MGDSRNHCAVKVVIRHNLEEEGIIHREQFNEIPPHVEYSFTEKGRDLMPIFYAMMNWGFKYEDE